MAVRNLWRKDDTHIYMDEDEPHSHHRSSLLSSHLKWERRSSYAQNSCAWQREYVRLSTWSLEERRGYEATVGAGNRYTVLRRFWWAFWVAGVGTRSWIRVYIGVWLRLIRALRIRDERKCEGLKRMRILLCAWMIRRLAFLGRDMWRIITERKACT